MGYGFTGKVACSAYYCCFSYYFIAKWTIEQNFGTAIFASREML
jgi:hypothetical protein